MTAAGGAYVIRPREASANDLDDATIVARVLAGDVDAFGLLVDRYERDLAAYARHVLGSADDAADVMQDALVRAYRSLARCGDPSRFKGWLFRIVSNQCKSQLTRRRRVVPVAELEPEPAAERDDPLADAGEADSRERLHGALERLSFEHREALVLRYVHELSVADIAEALGLSVSAVKMRLLRGREALRAELGGGSDA
jgi:RNA polymerase sigma-70 factor (ECF subfamily)